MAGFRDVVVADTTLIKLHRLLAERYPGTRTNSAPASAKLHLVMSVGGAGAQSVRISDGRACDHHLLRVGRWVRDRLLMFDLGYFRYQLLDIVLLPKCAAAFLARRVSRLLLHAAADPNLSRVLLLERVEKGCTW